MSVREQVLAAAVRVYAEVGYRGATTRRIAAEAGVNEITLFRHFGSKDALLHEAINQVGHRAAGHMSALPDVPGDPAVELLEWARCHLADLRARRSLIRTCFAEIEERPEVFPCQNSAPAQAAQALGAYLRRLREGGHTVAAFDATAASAMLMGALFADAMGRDVMPDMYSNDADDALREYVRLFLCAIGVAAPLPELAKDEV
jgi:AcrR family transcriptional regulator